MFALVSSLGGCGTSPAPSPLQPEPVPPPQVHPSLVVLLVVDQLPVRLLDAVAPLATGGFRQLAQGYTATGRHRHLATETCPGHATLSTGSAPNRSGIVSNAWSEGGKEVYCVPPTRDASLLKTDALADRVTDAGGRVVSLAAKDRAAIMLGGHHPTAAAWLDYGDTKLVQGIHLEALGPLRDWKAGCAGERVWTPLPDRVAGYAARFPDDQAFEADVSVTFPHTGACDDARRFLATPDAGTWLVDLGIGAVDQLKLGQSGHPDLLALSFSHIDVIGHTYTPDSWEALDALLRLDQELARLFTHLDATVGAGKWAVAMSSDHGAPGAPKPLPLQRAKDALAKADKAAGLGVSTFEEPFVWLAPGATPPQRAAVLATLRTELAGVEGVSAVVDASDRSTWPTEPKVAEALALGLFPGRSGDLVVLREDGYQWSNRPLPRGTTHGSTDDLDQRVPMWFWGAGVRAGTAPGDLDVRQVAPTVAALLGVDVPRDAQLPLVREALQR